MMRYLSRLSLLARQPGYTRFQYASNFHLRNKEDSVPFESCFYPVAENLVLNGNVGLVDSEATYKFLRLCARTYERVWWIPGPLELSHPKKCMSAQFDTMQEVVDSIDGTIYIGSKSQVILPGTDLAILATTGWGTSSELDKEVRWYEASVGGANPVDNVDIVYLAECEQSWIAKKVTERPKYKKLVFTHHEPDWRTNDQLVEAILFGNRGSLSGSPKKKQPWLGCNPFLVGGVRNSSYAPYAFYETKSEKGGGTKYNMPSGLIPAY